MDTSKKASKHFDLFDLDAGLLIENDVDLGAFCRDNDLEPEQVNAIGRMKPCEVLHFGGGAAPLFALRRVA